LARPNGFGAFFIVQIDRRGGPSFLHPGEDVWIAAGDTVVRVVRSTKVAAGSIFAEPKKPIKVGRGYRPA
jgi:voltage-gated potassium channel